MNETELLKERVKKLEDFIESLSSSTAFPLSLQRSLVAQGFFKLSSPLGTGVLYANSGVITAVTPASGSYYVATISGGTVNHFVQFTNGILTTA